MKKYNTIIVSFIILISCGFAIQVFGIANPAAVYCEELGYKYIMKETEDGQRGFCQFPNGVVVDGWKFFIGEEGKKYSYCQKQGLETKTIISELCQYASRCAVCVLKNGTEVKVTELMELNLKSTLSPWDPIKSTNGETEKPVTSETNYLFYFIGAIILVIFLVVAFVVYKKIKHRSDYY